MGPMQLVAAGFLLAIAMFVTTMLASPPVSEAAETDDGTEATSTPLVLVGP